MGEKTGGGDEQRKLVCAVIVSHNPNIEEFESNIQRIRQQANVLIVDNSTQARTRKVIDKMDSAGVLVISNGANLGVACAQNQGLGYAFRQGYQFGLLLDQDSAVPTGMVQALLDAYADLREQGVEVACIGPKAIHLSGKPVNSIPKIGDDYICVKQTLSSGMLIEHRAYEEVGPMDESLFIDLVDYEWCWRALAIGRHSFVAKQVLMPHSLGERQLIEGWIGVPAAIRHYYQYRNTLRMLSRGYVPLFWKVKSVLILMTKLVVFPLLVPPRLLRLRYILRGVIDFAIGKVGPIPGSEVASIDEGGR